MDNLMKAVEEAYLAGLAEGERRGWAEGFAEGFVEGFVEGFAEALEKAAQAVALKHADGYAADTIRALIPKDAPSAGERG